MKLRALLAAAIIAIPASIPAAPPAGQASGGPETILIASGNLTLRALVWRPSGAGPFPAVLFNHGSYTTDDAMEPDTPSTMGPVFARHGYVFLFLFRQGIGLSIGQGVADGDQMVRAQAREGQAGRNRVQLQLLETEELNEALAALAWLRARPEVDAARLVVVGHSFGGSLSLLLAERESRLRAAVVFGGAAGSWVQSPPLRSRLQAAVRRISAPVFFIYTANDYSTAPGKALAAEMQRLGKPHRLKIYPAFGGSAREGHNFLFRTVNTWESDVFGFLDEHVLSSPGPREEARGLRSVRTTRGSPLAPVLH
jgi:dienelactone hydrolase